MFLVRQLEITTKIVHITGLQSLNQQHQLLADYQFSLCDCGSR